MTADKESVSLVILCAIAIIGIAFFIASYKISNTGEFVQITTDEACGRTLSKCQGPSYFLGMYQNYAMCVCHNAVTRFDKNMQPQIYDDYAVKYISLERKY